MNFILVAAVSAVAILALWLATSLRRAMSVSSGNPIAAADRPETALLVVDVQPDFLGLYPLAAQSEALAAIREAILQARAQGWPVIAIRQGWQTPGMRFIARFFLGGRGLAWRPGTEVLPEIEASADHVVNKFVQDSFDNGALDRLLERLGVGRLCVVGLDGCACVGTTTLAALRRRYRVTIVAAAVLSRAPQRWTRVASDLARRGAAVLP